MKLVILLVFLPVSILAQSIGVGRYCSSHAFGSFCLTFSDNQLFEYSSSGCTQELIGNGAYSYSGDTLVLAFDQHPDETPFAKEVLVDSLSSHEQASLVLLFKDSETEEPLAVQQIVVTQGKDTLYDGSADSEGRVVLTSIRDNAQVGVFYKTRGRRASEYTFIYDKQREILFNLYVGRLRFVQQGTLEKYLFISQNDTSISFRDLGNNYDIKLAKSVLLKKR